MAPSTKTWKIQVTKGLSSNNKKKKKIIIKTKRNFFILMKLSGNKHQRDYSFIESFLRKVFVCSSFLNKQKKSASSKTEISVSFDDAIMQ